MRRRLGCLPRASSGRSASGTPAQLYVCVYICIYVYVCIYIYIYIYIYIPPISLPAASGTSHCHLRPPFVNMCCNCLTYLSVYLSIYLSLSLYLYIYIYIHTYLYMHNTYMLYIYIYIYVQLTIVCYLFERLPSGREPNVRRRVHAPTSGYTCMFTCMYFLFMSRVCICVYIYIYIYV